MCIVSPKSEGTRSLSTRTFVLQRVCLHRFRYVSTFECGVDNNPRSDKVTQLNDIKRQKARLEQLKREAEEEKERAREAARERVLQEFEKGQLGLAASMSVATTSGTDAKECMFSDPTVSIITFT